ncbi:MAG: DNA-directed RNA polymerase subunit omega [Candidatus Omnitrophica bacterium]|nr:DNA-directed RNA polymerase subunit omega [Candidatus Omnitrophota bacterium]
MEKVRNPNLLVNLVSRRVRQLNVGGSTAGRPLVSETANQGVADIALRELVEGKLDWEPVEESPLEELAAKKRKRT